MLAYFPTPYPDELWYSILCRYQIRSGNTDPLFTENIRHSLLLFPDCRIYETIRLLPAGTLDIKNVILNHTFFPYFCRMYRVEEKREMLNQLSFGIPTHPKWRNKGSAKTAFRYCPICKQEEQQRYGESYWHREHQLPFMTICTKHRCKLVEFTVNDSWKRNLFLPSFIEETTEPDFHIEPYERFLSDMLYQYLTMPLEIGPTNGYSNLQYELKKKYQYVLKGHVFILDTEQLYTDLVNLYGSSIVKACFGRQIRPTLSMQLQRWSFHAPEPYILLSVLLEQTPSITFGTPLSSNMIGKRVFETSELHIKNGQRQPA